MINKQNLWFITLFSLILILGIYYVSIDDDVTTVLKNSETSSPEVIEVTESDILVALEVEKEEEKQALLEEYQDILLDNSSSVSDKNNAYEGIQKINDSTSEEIKIKNKIKEKHNLESFVKIIDNTISIVINSKKHDTALANSIIKSVQELYEVEKYITVKFN